MAGADFGAVPGCIDKGKPLIATGCCGAGAFAGGAEAAWSRLLMPPVSAKAVDAQNSAAIPDSVMMLRVFFMITLLIITDNGNGKQYCVWCPGQDKGRVRWALHVRVA